MDKIVTSKTPHLDLHGEIESMVKVLVDEFIHDNVKMKNNVIIIIHGKSTNILTKKVHEVLKENKNVEDFKVNNWNVGETIVYLKI